MLFCLLMTCQRMGAGEASCWGGGGLLGFRSGSSHFHLSLQSDGQGLTPNNSAVAQKKSASPFNPVP